MPKFVTIGYGDPADYERTPLSAREASHAQDARLKSEGALMRIAGEPVQVRNTDALGTQIMNGAFLSSALPIVGFAVIEDGDPADAIEKVSKGTLRCSAWCC
jgi:hypothetical protein